MSGEAYELMAMLMRYIFVVLGAVILFRAFRQMRKDARAHRKEMKRLPDAGLIGEVVDLETGKSQPLPREGLMGSSSVCDIRLKRRGVARRHVLFAFVEGKGLQVKPHRGHKVAMEGVLMSGPAYALHGTQLSLGHANIRIRLFAGLNVPNPASFMPEETASWETMPEDEAYGVMPGPFDAVPVAQMGYPGWNHDGAEAFQPQVAQAPQGQWPVDWETQPSQPAQEGAEDYVPYYSPVERHRRSER